jgi:thiamine-monophosphate kinase
LFNPRGARWGVGDDAGLVDVQPGKSILVSTDRVPADLIAFKFGILDYRGLGAYLARLNLSDIAACNGRPLGMLLNLGLPASLPVSALTQLLLGALEVCESVGCRIIGGDLSDSVDLSISATALGEVDKERAISRQTAQPGDTVFASRPLGLTPAAFLFLGLSAARQALLPRVKRDLLWAQFSCNPMFDLADRLAASGQCTSCMDNTDGIGQSLHELSEASRMSVVIDGSVPLPDLVVEVCDLAHVPSLETALSAGADFSLLGTLSGEWSDAALRSAFGEGMLKLGTVAAGEGLYIRDGEAVTEYIPSGWNYYTKEVDAAKVEQDKKSAA